MNDEKCDMFESKAGQHLLENDVLKYKSSLRRRKREGLGELAEEAKARKPDSVEPRKYVYEGDDSCNHQMKSTVNIMSEFMSKRKSFFASEEESVEDRENEIVYE